MISTDPSRQEPHDQVHCCLHYVGAARTTIDSDCNRRPGPGTSESLRGDRDSRRRTDGHGLRGPTPLQRALTRCKCESENIRK